MRRFALAARNPADDHRCFQAGLSNQQFNVLPLHLRQPSIPRMAKFDPRPRRHDIRCLGVLQYEQLTRGGDNGEPRSGRSPGLRLYQSRHVNQKMNGLQTHKTFQRSGRSISQLHERRQDVRSF